MALDYLPVGEINFREDSQTPDNSGNRVPRHFYDVTGLGTRFRGGGGRGFHLDDPIFKAFCWSRWREANSRRLVCGFSHNARVDIQSLIRNAGGAIEVPCWPCAE